MKKISKIVIIIFLFLLTAISLITSVWGWYFGSKISLPNSGTYYDGNVTVGYAGMIMSCIILCFVIITFTTEVASDDFFKKHSIVFICLIIFISLLLIPSIIMGLFSFFDLGHVKVVT